MVYPVGKRILPPVYKLWLRKVEGLEGVPKDRPFIIAANHSSYYDALLVPCLIIPKVNKKIHALVNSYYWKNFAAKLILDWGESIPVYVEKEKGSGQKNKKAFEKALDYLKKGDLVMVFPEGKRSPDGKLQKAFTGIAKLALKSKIPVLPVGIIGAYKVLPKGKILLRFVRCDAKIGKLMYFDKYYHKKPNEKIFEEVTRSIMKEIAKLIGQKYNY